MTFDVAFRHQQALDPSALTTVGTTIHAISKAVEDCKNAGVDPEHDPAVILLSRHLHAVCGDRPGETMLQSACMHRIQALERSPVLVTLAHRGVSYDAPAKETFHREGQKAMRRLAKALGFETVDYDLRSNKGGIAVSGEITLHGAHVYVQLSLGLCGMDREVLFRSCRGRHDFTGHRNHFASVTELMDAEKFAQRIAHELQLTPLRAEQPAMLFG